MTNRERTRSTSPIRIAGIILVAVACATVAGAQDREGRWEFSLGTGIQMGQSLEFNGGSTVDTDDSWGFGMTVGYNITDNLALSFGMKWQGVDYDANVVRDGGSTTSVSGTYDTWGTSANLVYNLGEGPLVPYAGAGIGWTWIDTNVPNGIPHDTCYWDPWYGYICYTDYPTKTEDAMSYQALLGLRYEFSPRSYMRVGYVSQWLDLSEATTTPRFDVITMDFGWVF